MIKELSFKKNKINLTELLYSLYYLQLEEFDIKDTEILLSKKYLKKLLINIPNISIQGVGDNETIVISVVNKSFNNYHCLSFKKKDNNYKLSSLYTEDRQFEVINVREFNENPTNTLIIQTDKEEKQKTVRR